MQPGYPSSGQDPYGQPHTDPSGQQPYAQPVHYELEPQYTDPYGQAEPISGANPFPTSGANPYPTSGGTYPPPAVPYPPPNPYYAPGYGAPPPTGQANALGIVALVLGIMSIPLGCCGVFGLIVPIPALVCGVLGIKKAQEGRATNKGIAIAGVACAVVGIIIGVFFMIFQVMGSDPTN
jgi:hypothetical protein